MRSLPWPELVARLRRGVVAHPIARWVLAGGLALAAATLVTGRVAAAERTRSAWATRRPVLVATAPIGAGRALTSAATELRLVPVAAVPDNALSDLPPDAVALDELVAGEVVLASHTALGGGRASMLPAGTSGVAVPLPVGWEPVPGDQVTVVGLADPVGLGDPGPATGVLAEGAVISSGTDGVLLAVPDADAAAVAEAGAAGRAVLVLRRAPVPPDP